MEADDCRGLYPYGIQNEVDRFFGYHCRSMMLYHTGT